MHDLSFFLLKNWLPVGISAIVFFCIGLLLAKFIWGSFSKRLTFAVDENLNLASQWSALGVSQRDLFKKLRARWQADRDNWESTISAKDRQIAALNRQLIDSGKAVPSLIPEEDPAEIRIKELESLLEQQRVELDLLRTAAASDESVSASLAPLEDTTPDLQSRIRDLEQDLIDTHDELHDVRTGYVKQLKLVESLEAKLIENRDAALIREELRDQEQESGGTASESPTPAEVVQLTALLSIRNREMHHFRTELTATRKLMTGNLATLRAEFEAKEKEVASLHANDRQQLEDNIAGITEELENRKALLAKLETDLEQRNWELEAAQEKIVEFDLLQRRKTGLQSELNDACHELYDVRKALNARISEMESLEKVIEGLGLVENENAALQSQLEFTREELAGTLQALSSAEEQLKDTIEELEDLRGSHTGTVEENESLLQQLSDTRHELSDVRLSYNEKVAEYQKAIGQMEELEAIIEDRGAEVNDLSAELRLQRDQVRLLKNSLAESEGELEALAEESRNLSTALKRKEGFADEQRERIAALELALAERYNELNRARVDSDEHSRNARYFEAKTSHLEAELERRKAEFDESGQKMAGAELALEEASARIEALSFRLEESGRTLEQLREELHEVSREKDGKIRELEQAMRRMDELEAAAKVREEELKAAAKVQVEELEAAAKVREEAARVQMKELEAAAQVREEAAKVQVEELEAAAKVQVEELEAAAKVREEQLVLLERERGQYRDQSADLEHRLTRLSAELDQARTEQEVFRLAISELEEALSAGDERTLHLSRQLEEKESEVSALLAELGGLRELLDSREAGRIEAEVKLSSLQSELEARLLEAREEASRFAAEDLEVIQEKDSRIAELESELQVQSAKLQRESAERETGLAQIEKLRGKMEKRSEIIRDLQSRINMVMMQRSTRDKEIDMLKERLEAVSVSANHSVISDDSPVREQTSVPGFVDGLDDLEAAIEDAFSDAGMEGEGIPLESLVEEILESVAEEPSETPIPEEQPAAERPGPERPGPERASSPDAENTIFFDEAAASLSDAEKAKIDQCARLIRRYGRKAEVTVIGYAGAEGTADFNESLSARRADAVRERLLERGVSQAVVTVRGAGQDRRFSDSKARRVEMVVAAVAVAEAVN